MKILKLSWQDQLREAHKTLAKKGDPFRLAVVGVGNTLNGDDAAGVAVVREMASRLAPPPHVLLVEGGTAPENLTGLIRRFNPDWTILVDAAWLGEIPGAVAWLDPLESDGFSASTHTLPLSLLSEYLAAEFSCRVSLIGIQPKGLEMDEGLSAAVADAAKQVAEALSALVDEV
jgi:hydrogenase 3 maturation protease